MVFSVRIPGVLGVMSVVVLRDHYCGCFASWGYIMEGERGNGRSSGHRVFTSKILFLEQLVSLVVVVVIGLDGGGECITGGKSP